MPSLPGNMLRHSEFEAECEEHIGYFINNKFELEDAVKAIVG